MAEQNLTNNQANALSGSGDPATGLVYPTALEDPWLAAFYRFGHRLNDIASLANNLRPYADDADNTTLGIRPGRCGINGFDMSFAGGTVNALANNNITNVWLYEAAGQPAIGSGLSSSGWPAMAHIKIAQATVAAGAIESITDLRGLAMLHSSISYALSIESQGDTSTPSRIHISGSGEADFIRIRVCDEGGYQNATNATITPAGDSSAAQTLTADKDLVLKSSDAGLFEIDLANPVEESVTLRIGPADLSPRNADYAQSIVVAHAAS